MATIFQAKQPFFGLVAGLLNQVFSKGAHSFRANRAKFISTKTNLSKASSLHFAVSYAVLTALF
jgi:hypothetical protein